MDTAKHAAGPGAIIGSIITAVTAIIQANDTSLEQKTYETLAQSNVAMQAEIKMLSERVTVFEQALIVSVLNGRHPVAAPPAPVEPEAAAPEPSRSRAPRRPAGRLGGSAMEQVDNLFGAAAPAEAEMPHLDTAQKVADILDRDLTIEDGQVEIAPPPVQQRKKADLPSWNAISE